MKIDAKEAYNVFLRPQEAQNQSAKTTNGIDFASFLNQSAPSSSSKDLGLINLPQVDIIGQLQVNQAAKAESSSPYGAAEDIEAILNLLDDYSQALANPQNTLKDLAPMADDLGLMAQELGQSSQTLSASDPLKALSQDTAQVAMVEALKFKRGDYL
ncbi:MAG: hypothetical protein LBS60_12390 [Deltaproteobacteria bacterium]|jgi:hypothetical protein|nr:hypothetical protein [Deltaproteobacteria bacterium]